MALTKLTGAGPTNVVWSSAAVVATGLNSSDSFPSGAFKQGTFQVVSSGMTGTATYELQTSNDGTNWDTVTGTSFTTSGASGTHSINVAALPGVYCRITITAAAGAGSLACTAVFKGRA